ncbi:glycosyltransferase [Plebeiibacterium marinum]|uniref:Glycosyltransferase n=1 Tax=Plebeiibacterium marinum TaxID=2992111 RepID=A0AAE3MER5_9BACT|nr:glycosyltransferase [Plebeiobacterium marinum]MCW3806241.1 glycosyltransferase [Plebeiobacterium marinum]
MPKFSVIIPVYNRPQEVDELLHSLSEVNYTDFEVIIIEDGSHLQSEDICNGYKKNLDIHYHYQKNSGPGPARNEGAKHATGDILIFFDSDCLIPENYFTVVEKSFVDSDCYGGPDRAHESFNNIQKAINYSMTSILTTGGIRGGNKKMDKFYPRSFNLGIKKQVFMELKGFKKLRFGEDLDFSMRLIEKGHTSILIEDAWVFHKRRNNFKSFFKQVYNSGIARINLNFRHPGTIKMVHWIPAIFTIAYPVWIIISLLVPNTGWLLLIPPIAFLTHALFTIKEVIPSFLATITSFTQIFGYGSGFLSAFIKRNLLKQGEFNAFEENFYQ